MTRKVNPNSCTTGIDSMTLDELYSELAKLVDESKRRKADGAYSTDVDARRAAVLARIPGLQR